MSAPGPSVIHWFRRDLRLADNLSLWRAVATRLPVVPVYVTSGWSGSHAWTGPNRQHFLCGCLAALDRDLQGIGGRLIIRHGDAVDALRRVLRESGAVALHFNLVPDPYGKQVEHRVRAMCAEMGVACHGHMDAALHGPDELLTQSGGAYRVFTPFSRVWLGLPKPPPVGRPAALGTPENLDSLPLPTVAHWGWRVPSADLVAAGEAAARDRLRRALAGPLRDYADHRDLPAQAGTSRLSQDLRFGLLSVRTVHAAAVKARAAATTTGRAGIDAFIRQLAWREFYFAILHHFPSVLDEEFNPQWRGLPWDHPGAGYDAWCRGLTGFPLVDAGMRELLATGYMHNRLRMITAMFLTKDLHHDWKLGESHFMRHLVDGEIALNNGGWQWSAGTGADAAPYFRIQNPWTQSASHDPSGSYIKRWIPELAAVDPARFMRPPADGRPLAGGYPMPILDHGAERLRTLAIFQRHRQQNS